MVKAERILVPLDGSALADMALPRALELLSDRPRATPILLRAVEAMTLPGADPIEAQVTVVREAQSYLADSRSGSAATASRTSSGPCGTAARRRPSWRGLAPILLLSAGGMAMDLRLAGGIRHGRGAARGRVLTSCGPFGPPRPR